MKKALSLLLALCMILAFAGCGSKREAAKDALDAVLKNPATTLSVLQSSADPESEEFLSEESMCKAMLSGMKYTIKDAAEDGDTAVVTAEITNADASEILKTFVTEMFSFALEQAFSEDPMSDEDQEAYFVDLLTEIYSRKDLKTVTNTVKVNMSYADDKWNINNPDELADALVGGFISCADNMDDYLDLSDMGDDLGFGGWGEDYSDSPFNIDYALSNETLVDNDTCVIRITDVTFDTDWNDLSVNIYCENKADYALDFDANSVIVCGYTINNYWFENVAAGKKVNSDLTLNIDELEKAGIESLDELILNMTVSNADDWLADPVLKDSFVLYPTGKSAGSVTYPARRTAAGEQVIIDNEYCTLIMLDIGEDYWGPEINCYVENKTDVSLYISMDNVSVNDYMIEPYWGVTLGAGARIYSEVSFDSDDFDANGITDIEKLEFSLYAHDDTSWDECFRTDCVYEP